MKTLIYATILVLAAAAHLLAASAPVSIKHVTVFHRPGRYGGWPANHGAWSWGNEILVGFSAAYFQWTGPDRHPYDRGRPEEPYLARSLDGGETWRIEPAPSLAPPQGMFTAAGPGGKAADLTQPIDFTHPGFAMTLRMSDAQQGTSWFFYSYDRGKTWKGPFNFPMLGQTAIMARTDYVINGKRDAMVFLTAAKAGGREGRPFAARTNDGGLHWEFVAWVAPDPKEGFTIMPSSVRLSKTEILTTVRHEDSVRQGPNWIDAYLSRDNGNTWRFLNRPVADTGAKSGNPPSLSRLKDGRLVIAYGYRSQPYSIRARISNNGGRSWGPEMMLRDGGASWDLGYTRNIERPDGRIVTVYYWAPVLDQERIIEATIWEPSSK
jgi:hypothetical protein